MIIRSADDVTGTEHDVSGDHWRSRRILTAADRMGYSLNDVLIEPGFDLNLEYRHHLEACYVVDRTDGDHRCSPPGASTRWARAGSTPWTSTTAHIARSAGGARLVCIFNPALRGTERHVDGGYEPSDELRLAARRGGGPARRAARGRSGDGAPSMRSLPDWVFGKAITSRMLSWSVSSAAQRSRPIAIPPCGGAPYSSASSRAPNWSRMPSIGVTHQREGPLEEVAPMDPDRSAAQLPAIQREVVLLGVDRGGVAFEVVGHLPHRGAERVVGRVPAVAFGVPFEHREAVDPHVGQDVRRPQLELGARARAGPGRAPRHRGVGVGVGHGQDEVAGRRATGLADLLLGGGREMAGDRAAKRAIGLDRQVDEAARAMPNRELGQLIGLTS